MIKKLRDDLIFLQRRHTKINKYMKMYPTSLNSQRNVNSNHNDILLYPFRMATIKKIKDNNCKNVEKREPWCTVAKRVNWQIFCMKNSMEFPPKLKRKLWYNAIIYFWVYFQRKKKSLSWRDNCIPLFTAVSFTT